MKASATAKKTKAAVKPRPASAEPLPVRLVPIDDIDPSPRNRTARNVDELVASAREHGIHPSLPTRWREELAENPEKAFSGNGKRYKYEARIAELERLLGQAHAENELLKKAFAMTQKKAREERIKPILRGGT